MLFSDKNLQTNINLKIGGKTVEQVGQNCKEKYFKFVGHVIDDKLSWEGHVEHVSKKLASANYAINSSKHFLPLRIRLSIYYIFLNPILSMEIFSGVVQNQNHLRKYKTFRKDVLEILH